MGIFERKVPNIEQKVMDLSIDIKPSEDAPHQGQEPASEAHDELDEARRDLGERLNQPTQQPTKVRRAGFGTNIIRNFRPRYETTHEPREGLLARMDNLEKTNPRKYHILANLRKTGAMMAGSLAAYIAANYFSSDLGDIAEQNIPVIGLYIREAVVPSIQFGIGYLHLSLTEKWYTTAQNDKFPGYTSMFKFSNQFLAFMNMVPAAASAVLDAEKHKAFFDYAIPATFAGLDSFAGKSPYKHIRQVLSNLKEEVIAASIIGFTVYSLLRHYSILDNETSKQFGQASGALAAHIAAHYDKNPWARNITKSASAVYAALSFNDALRISDIGQVFGAVPSALTELGLRIKDYKSRHKSTATHG